MGVLFNRAKGTNQIWETGACRKAEKRPRCFRAPDRTGDGEAERSSDPLEIGILSPEFPDY